MSSNAARPLPVSEPAAKALALEESKRARRVANLFGLCASCGCEPSRGEKHTVDCELPKEER